MLHRTCMCIPQNFIRFFTEFEVEPAKLSIVTTDDQVIPRWMDVHRRNPAYAGSEHFQEFLFGQVIDSNVALCL
jgi:hypothetical protein